MTEKTVNVFICDFCKKKYFSKRWITYHEKICNHNPENSRPCYGCKWFDKIKTHDHRDSVVNVFYCEKKEITLYPPQSVIRDNLLTLPSYDNCEMPKTCDDYTQPSPSFGLGTIESLFGK